MQNVTSQYRMRSSLTPQIQECPENPERAIILIPQPDCHEQLFPHLTSSVNAAWLRPYPHSSIINALHPRNTSISPCTTKIVATLGPSTDQVDVMTEMIQAGVRIVRLNFSHGEAAEHIGRARHAREAAQTLGTTVAVMVDLQGPKLRIGRFEDNPKLGGKKIKLSAGDTFVFDTQCTLGNQHRVGLDYKDLPKDVQPGDTLVLGDGEVTLKVESISEDQTQIRCTVLTGGIVSNNKGINKAGGGLSAAALTNKDIQDMQTAMSEHLRADYLAISFPRSASDMKQARQRAERAGYDAGHTTRTIAKIERAEAIQPEVLQEILKASDAVMVARGDLAVEIGHEHVPEAQERIIKMANDAQKMVITATQMMESMTTNATPTRAEVADVQLAVLQGSDALILSGETATGNNPVEAVKQMAKNAAVAERRREQKRSAVATAEEATS